MSRPIRLLRIARVNDDRLGGMSRTMYETGDHLQKMGFEVDYMFAQSFSRRISPRLWRFTGPWEAATLAYARSRKERSGYDLIEFHEPLTLGAALLRPLLFTTARIIGFSYGIEARGWPIELAYTASHRLPLRRLSRLTGGLQARQSLAGLRHCDHVVCSNSEDLRYLARMGIRKEKLTLHHSGVDQSMVAAGRRALRRSGKEILYIGSWIHRKGILELVPAFQRLLQDDPDVRLTIGGCRVPASEILTDFPNSVHHAVTVIPCIDSESRLREIYSAHNVFVLPSYFEGQPLVMMEAAAFGLAIVTTPVCGMLDFIRDGENGLLAAVGDTDALHAKLKALADNPDLRIRLGEAARAEATQFTWEKSARNLANAYRAIAARLPGHAQR